MKDSLTKVLTVVADDPSVDRIMAASFFRPRPMQAGATAQVIHLDERRGLGPRSS